MGGLAPTSKPKLPSFLSFPIGADGLSASLKAVPQFSSLELVFSADPILSTTKFRRLIEADKPHVVLRARFERWDRNPSIGNESWVQEYLHGKWSLWVYPVRRQRKAQAREALVGEGLPRIAEWLSVDRPSSWYFGRNVCEIVFLPKESAVRVDQFIKAT
jgi:hypothetical protein